MCRVRVWRANRAVIATAADGPRYRMLGWVSQMVDIHSHILWELDDGSGSVEESIAMMQVARESGTTDIVASPHSNAEFTYQPELSGPEDSGTHRQNRRPAEDPAGLRFSSQLR